MARKTFLFGMYGLRVENFYLKRDSVSQTIQNGTRLRWRWLRWNQFFLTYICITKSPCPFLKNICLYLSRVSLIGCYWCSIVHPKGHIVLLSLTEYICTSSQYDTDDHSIFNKPDNKSYEEAMIGWLSSQQEHQSPHLCLPSPHHKYLPPTLARVINKLSWVVHFPGNMSILNCVWALQILSRLQTSLISQNWSPVSQ